MSSIKEISGKVVYDSRGQKTIEVTVVFDDGENGVASVPAGKSRGIHEVALIDPEIAVKFIAGEFSKELVGKCFESQRDFDNALVAFDGTKEKSHFGGNTILALSVAFARALAEEKKIPLYKYFGEALGEDVKRGQLRLYANIVNGGLHAKSNLRFQEHIAIPAVASFKKQEEEVRKLFALVGKKLMERYESEMVKIGDEGGYALEWKKEDEPFEIMKEARDELGFSGMDFGMDAAASDIKDANDDELLELYKNWHDKFGLIYIEDPFHEEDFEYFKKLKNKMPNVAVTGDDLTTTNIELMKKARESDSVNGVIIKPNQIGTITEALQAVRLARDYGWSVVVSHRSGETLDDWITDFAVGSGADGFKLGAPSKPERIAKYDRLLQIEG
jgi:enolase